MSRFTWTKIIEPLDLKARCFILSSFLYILSSFFPLTLLSSPHISLWCCHQIPDTSIHIYFHLISQKTKARLPLSLGLFVFLSAARPAQYLHFSHADILGGP